MDRALYGPDGFFMREEPGAHFRTSVHVSPLFAEAVARLLARVDAALGHPAELTLLDVGAGRGELLRGVLDALAETDGADGGPAAGLARRVRPVAVERASRPEGLDPRIGWRRELPPPGSVTGLVFANEWLDNVPVDLAETDAVGVPRYVEVDRTGTERLGGPVVGEDADWLARWWPLGGRDGAPPVPGGAPWPGLRAEIGSPRDTAWAEAVHTLDAGLAVAADYGHTRADRPPFGTLTGYLDGREVRPVPDGERDLTAHVALDACAAAAAGDGDGGVGAVHTQRAVLHALGVHGGRPPLALASADPAGYVRALRTAGEAAELTDPHGLGAFSWLVCPVGVADPFG
ncbi:SAM-dependent methyltransferase [Streptomyces sp. N2-109]|uniref:SAM-dependent methyltransferase n=1 Tax=Streptomyces gossypii TaxID=2883101 RepID=A0ABT2JQ68_9ACTN|nr:SAM-dependent methyltransferase [Streptomyces gossypii]MCT2590024.1 SAM-dependent methyltransferase [Streptomyces gossypii]